MGCPKSLAHAVVGAGLLDPCRPTKPARDPDLYETRRKGSELVFHCLAPASSDGQLVYQSKLP